MGPYMDQLRSWLNVVIQRSNEAIIALDQDQRVLAANSPAKTLLGWRSQEIAGQSLTDLITLHLLQPQVAFEALLKDVWHADSEMNLHYRADIELPNGDRLPVIGQLHAVCAPSGEDIGALLVFRQTEHMSASLPERAWQLALIQRMTQALIASLELDEVLRTLLMELRNALGVVATSVWLVEPEIGTLVCCQATGPKRDQVIGWRLPPDVGIVGWVVQHRESALITDALHDERHFGDIDEQTALALRSILAVPLRIQDEVIGVLEVVDNQPQRFGPEDLALVERLAPMAALAIKNAQLYGEADDLRRFNENIVRSLEEGILLLDSGGRITFANSKAAVLLGYAPEEIVGQAMSELVMPESIPTLLLMQPDRLYNGQAPREIAMRTRTGQPLPVLYSARALSRAESATSNSVLAVFMDITQRKDAEEALRRSEQRFRSLVDAADEMIILHDPNDGRIEFAHVPERFGVQEADLLGKTVSAFDLPEETTEAFQESLQQVVKTGQSISYETGIVVGNKQFAFLSTLSPLTDDDGDVTGVLSIAHDITQRKRMEEEFLHTERLATTGKLAASVAHEINNPLQSVLGCLGLAQEALLDGREVGQYVQIAREEVRRIASIVSHMRNLYRPSSGKRRFTNIKHLLDEVLQLTAKSRRDQGVDVTWQVSADLSPLFIEPDQIRQVFLNLILNAIAAMPHGGDLTVRATKTTEPDGVEVLIRDTGVGIPEDVRPHIFDAFFSTKPDGTGLGLTISAGIVRQHKGTLTVESEPGKGSTFRVWLPMILPPSDNSEETV